MARRLHAHLVERFEHRDMRRARARRRRRARARRFSSAPACRAKSQALAASGRTSAALRGGVRAGRGAVAHPAGDALQDRGEAEEIVGEIDRQMRPRIEAGARHIGVDIGRQRRNAERREIEPDQRAGAGARDGGMCHCIR